MHVDMGNQGHKRMYKRCEEASASVTSRLPYYIPLLCVQLTRRRFLVFAWNSEGGDSRPLRVLEVCRSGGWSTREITYIRPEEYPVSMLYDMYAGWCIRRIVEQDTSRTVCKDHANV